MKAHHALVADFIPFSWVDGPGNRFVLFLQGCNFNCLACHNPQTIALQSQRAELLSVEEVLSKIRKSTPYITGVTVSGGEATLQSEFIYTLFRAIKDDPELCHLTTFIDSNGSAKQDTWERLAPVTDGAMIDLKVLDETKHLALTGSSNGEVVKSIRILTDLSLLYEVRLLLLPRQNDSELELAATAEFLLAIDPNIRIKVNRFMTHGVRAQARKWTEVSEEEVLGYKGILRSNGVKELA